MPWTLNAIPTASQGAIARILGPLLHIRHAVREEVLKIDRPLVGRGEVVSDGARLWVGAIFIAHGSAGSSQRHHQSFRFGEGALVGVEGEELRGAEVEGGGDVQDVGEAVARRGRVFGAEVLGQLVNRGPIGCDDFESSAS